MDIQRTILWVVFAMSIVVLWENWQRSEGRPALLTSATPAAETAGVAGPLNGASNGPLNAAKDASVPVTPATTPATPPAAAAALEPAEQVSAAAASTKPRGEPVRVRTDVLEVDIDPLGAVLERVELLNQSVEPNWTTQGLAGLVTGKKPGAASNVVLLDINANRTYVAETGVIGAAADAAEGFPTHAVQWKALDGPRSLAAGSDALSVKFAAESGGVRVTKTFTFHRGRNDIEVSHDVTNISDAPLSPWLYLQIKRDGNKPEGESTFYSVYTGPAVYSEEKKFQKVEFKNIEKGKAEFVKTSPTGWIAMIQHYFTSAWVPPEGVTRTFYALNPSANLFVIGSKFPLGTLAPGATVTRAATFYVGPQDQGALEKLAPGLELVVDYGVLTFIAKPLFWLLKLLHSFLGNWGWAIVLATFLIKLAFYPLSAASYKSMARMKEITPRMMKIREQYANDKNKMNLAMMDLYKNEKINPLGGCLPILIQIPVFIAYYWVILGTVEMRNAPWVLWVHDLATPDPWFILPVVMIGTMWVQYKLNPTPPDPLQAKVMAAMPFIFGAMFFFFPAGLVLYWLINNVLSIAQQWYITRQINAAKPVG